MTMTDQMSEDSLAAMRGPEGPKIVPDDVVVSKIEGDRVTFAAPAPHVDSYAEAITHAMQRAFAAQAAIDAEARKALAAQRAEGPRTLTHNEEAKQKGDAFMRSMNGYLGRIREAEIARGVPENQATKLLAEPTPPSDEPALDNHDGPGPQIVVEDNQVAMHKLFTIGGQRVLGSSKGICLEPPA